MKQEEFEKLVERIVEEKINEKFEERMEAMFYKTLVESNMMSNVISTIYENIDREPKTSLTETKVEKVSKPKPRRVPTLNPVIEGMGMYFEGTTPIDDGGMGSAKLKAESLQEGVHPELIGDEGVDLDIFANVADFWREDIEKYNSGE